MLGKTGLPYKIRRENSLMEEHVLLSGRPKESCINKQAAFHRILPGVAHPVSVCYNIEAPNEFEAT